MKKIIITLTALILLFLSLSCCPHSSSVLIETMIICDNFIENPHGVSDSVNIDVGDKVTIKLCSNATTGFSWDYVMSDDNVVKEEDYDFEEPDSDLPGSAGTEVWTFEGTQTGTTVINFEYSRPWEEDTEPAWTYKVIITVE